MYIPKINGSSPVPDVKYTGMSSFVGTDVARLQNKLEGKEKNALLKLERLFEKQSDSLDAALGSGKGAALKNFVAALRKSLMHRETEFSELEKNCILPQIIFKKF